eukprot:gene18327-24017_t
MLKNLLAALQFGYPVYARCGHLGLYGLFLTGGALAVLPSPLHNKSKENFKQIVKQSSDSIKNKYGLPDFIANPLESLMTGAGDVAASLLLPSLGVGSSVEESRIDHAAHVQGTLFGILFAILVEIFYLR